MHGSGLDGIISTTSEYRRPHRAQRKESTMNRIFSRFAGAALVAATGLAPLACDRPTTPVTTNPTTPTAPRDMTPAPRTDTTPREPDNTGINRRDLGTENKTPLSQSESASDVAITAEIRRAVMAETLSVNASNCKIMTVNGVVTLRGPVASIAERDLIQAKATAVAGVKSVVNELEVTAP